MKALDTTHQVDSTLYFPVYPNIIFRTFWSLYAPFRILNQHHKKPFDLIHSHGYSAGLVAKIVSRIAHIPVVHTVHGSSMLDTRSKGLKATLEKWLLTEIKYDAEISVATTFLKHKNINSNVHIIPNGVNVADFDEIEETKNAEPTIIWVGRNDPIKGLKILKQAIVKVRKTIPNLKVKLVTGGSLTGKALIKAYKKAHVFVLPSLAEGQPITLLEAWAAKLPVIVTSVGDNPLMVKDGVTGYLVEPNNATKLANAILKMFRTRTKDIQMGEAGYTLVKKCYAWEQVAEQTWDVYEEVLQ
jgi:glycosyltransferase involved in cell wall biosynthesis